MQLLGDFLSISKVSLFAFIVICAVLMYEIRLYILKRNKKKLPSIPQFNGNASPVVVPAPVMQMPVETIKPSKYRLSYLLAPTLIVITVLASASIFIAYKSSQSTNSLNTRAESVPTVTGSILPSPTNQPISITSTPQSTVTESLSPTSTLSVTSGINKIANNLITVFPTATHVPVDSITLSPTEAITSTPEPSPTAFPTATPIVTGITSLPETGIVNTLLFFSIIAGSLILFAFIY